MNSKRKQTIFMNFEKEDNRWYQGDKLSIISSLMIYNPIFNKT